MGYKIVTRHLRGEDPSIKHDEDCTDIVYMIDTGNGTFPVAFKTLKEARAKLTELNNTRN